MLISNQQLSSLKMPTNTLALTSMFRLKSTGMRKRDETHIFTYAYCLYFIAVHTRHTRAAKTGYSRMYTPRHMRSDSPK